MIFKHSGRGPNLSEVTGDVAIKLNGLSDNYF